MIFKTCSVLALAALVAPILSQEESFDGTWYAFAPLITHYTIFFFLLCKLM